ncbi:fimbria/pilus outer membrane usher protein, partial [Escherichia coli]|uniref:phage tail tube protein n=1 Tax=Escherichia coli TaxID=562 RepID=UPI001369518A
MPTPNPLAPVKGAGTTLWVYKGNGDPYANPLSDVDWSRLAKVKDLTPGELTAESYDDSYLDDEDADWTATGQGQKSAGDTSFTLAAYRYSTAGFYTFQESNDLRADSDEGWQMTYNKRQRLQLDLSQSIGSYGSFF